MADTSIGFGTARLIGDGYDDTFDISLGDTTINTYMSPDSTSAGINPTASGDLHVSEIGYYGNQEFWKVETSDANGTVTTAWIRKNDLVDATTGRISSDYIDDSNRSKYDAAELSTEAYEARMQSIAEERRRQHLADPTNPDYMNDEELLQYQRDKFGYDINRDPDATVGINNWSTDEASLWVNQPPKVSGLERYAYKIMRVFGMPPQWSDYVDPRVDYGSAIVGRRYSETILAAPTILSLCPGKLEYSQGLIDVVQGDADMLSALTGGTFEPFWHFKENWDNTISEGGGYVACANIMCRYAAVCLSVNGEYEKGGEIPLGNKDCAWGYGTYMSMDVSRFLDPNPVARLIGSKFAAVVDTVTNAALSLERHFVHFNLNGSVGMGEEFNTETRASIIENLVNGSVDNTVKDIAFMVGGEMGADVESDLQTFEEVAKSTLGGSIGAIISAGHEMLRGGSISFPKVIDTCTWGRSVQFNVKFTSVYGDVESRFLNVIMPYICLMAFFLPKQLKNKIDMYTYPPVVRAFARGVYACDIGVLTGISVKRGGEDDSMWTASGQPMEIDVSFTIQSLHQNLMQSDNPIWLAKNVGLQLYIGTICGIDMTMPQKDLIKKSLESFTSGIFEDVNRNLTFTVWNAVHNNPITQAFINTVNMGR